MIRAIFLYGNYDGLNKTPQFDLYLGNTRWTRVDDSYYTEMIHTPSTNKLQICLINVGQGTPFISSLEFRELPYLSYFTLYSLYLYGRYDMGSITNEQYRFGSYHRYLIIICLRVVFKRLKSLLNMSIFI